MSKKEIEKLKVSTFDRRMSLAKAGLKVGGRWAQNTAGGMFLSKQDRDAKNKQFVHEQAQYLVDEIGKLKGSLVKIGQMVALYGEHFLPKEIVEALHTLNNKTKPVSWSVLEPYVKQTLGADYAGLEVDTRPLGTASLAQVHRARRKSDGLEVVLKIQYPGVAEAVDSDLTLFKSLIKMTNVVPQTREFEEWFDEVREMMHREVDYACEAATTKRFYERLKNDERYIVPRIIDELTCGNILCMTYEEGLPVNASVLFDLCPKRANAIGDASMEIMVKELFEWGEMQTDPNFGNYLIRLGQHADQSFDAAKPDKIVLLDFGAIREFDAHLLGVAQGLLKAGHKHSKTAMLAAMHGYRFFDDMQHENKDDMADLFLLASEPFSDPAKNPHIPPVVLEQTDDGVRYRWATSNLHTRVMKASKSAMNTRYFTIPPKEFMFISRKFIGAYTFMTVIDARTKTYELVAAYE